jgi:hypothetical protein
LYFSKQTCNSVQQSSGEISGPHGGEYEDNSSATLRRAVWQKLTDVSGILTDDGGSKHLYYSVGQFLSD